MPHPPALLPLVVLMASGIFADAMWAAPTRQSTAPQTRKLAPGVEQTIPVAREEADTNAVQDVVELTVGIPDLKWAPKEYEPSLTLFRRAQKAIFRRGIWQLQITFKPLRMIPVDLPQPNGKMKREMVWYMVYRIANPGKHMTPVQAEPAEKEGQFHSGEWTIERSDTYQNMYANIGPHLFNPTFLLRTHQDKTLAIDDYSVEHLDVILPAARRAIYQRERPNCSFDQFYDSARIGAEPVPISADRGETSRYGVVTWIHVEHPLRPDGKLDMTRKVDIDFFTVQIMGLTNAYVWKDQPQAFKPGDPHGAGREFEYKTLEFTFYRPGDEFDAREDEIRWGVPGHRRYDWLYRPAVTTYKPHRPNQ
ncbi:MAG: hypothetical protein OES79_07490 [Planctomycetota bacterium]|nr:hypothetical protein [Planctomycetota bacterium]